MRHQNSGRGLSRSSSHRKAMFRNMMVSVIKHETIQTTVAKAKDLRMLFEPMITLAKNDTLHGRRIAYNRLRDREAVTKLFNELGPFYQRRPGGYLRILKNNFRRGDCAPMAVVELVDRSKSEESAA